MKKRPFQKFFPLVLIFLTLNVNESLNCSQPGYQKVYIKQIDLTEDINVLRLRVHSPDINSGVNSSIWNRPIYLNIETNTIDITPRETYSSGMHESSYISRFNSSLSTSNNDTFWYIYNETGSFIGNTTIKDYSLDMSNSRIFISDKYNLAYLIYENYPNIYSGFKTNSTVLIFNISSKMVENTSSIFWDYTDSSPSGVIVFEGEGLVLQKAGCCYCVNSYVYTYSATHIASFFEYGLFVYSHYDNRSGFAYTVNNYWDQSYSILTIRDKTTLIARSIKFSTAYLYSLVTEFYPELLTTNTFDQSSTGTSDQSSTGIHSSSFSLFTVFSILYVPVIIHKKKNRRR